MKVIPVAESQARAEEIAAVVTAGGLACIPLRGAYRIIADARSEAAVVKLAQSKRRAHNRPALIMVADLASAKELVDGTTWALTIKLTKKLWPGPLTLVLPPSKRLDPKVSKILTRKTGSLGIRVPDDKLSAAVIAACGIPLLVSSANIESKPGSTSAAAVKQRFDRTVELWVDAGDVKPEPPSTLVELTETEWKLVREGSITRAAIELALA